MTNGDDGEPTDRPIASIHPLRARSDEEEPKTQAFGETTVSPLVCNDK
jgi:antitoxin (DNA-binding transcriptional repressor) of toxin-antitoxin stability system